MSDSDFTLVIFDQNFQNVKMSDNITIRMSVLFGPLYWGPFRNLRHLTLYKVTRPLRTCDVHTTSTKNENNSQAKTQSLSKEDGIKLHIEGLRHLCCSPNIIRMIKLKNMRWAGHVERTGGGTRCASLILSGKPEGKKPLEKLMCGG